MISKSTIEDSSTREPVAGNYFVSAGELSDLLVRTNPTISSAKLTACVASCWVKD